MASKNPIKKFNSNTIYATQLIWC